MSHWNWINEVYNYDEACAKIDELNAKISEDFKKINTMEKLIEEAKARMDRLLYPNTANVTDDEFEQWIIRVNVLKEKENK